MSGDISPLPPILVLDTSFLRTVGGPGATKYDAFIDYVRQSSIHLYLSPKVQKEAREQRRLIGADWLGRADDVDWINLSEHVEPGARLYDGPHASHIIDHVHERIADLEQENPDEMRKTDAEVAGLAVVLLASKSSEHIGVVFDDGNAEHSVEAVLADTLYEDKIRVLNVWDVVEHAKEKANYSS